MNAVRRKQIKSIISKIEEIKNLLDDVKSEEEFTCGNIPEGFVERIGASEYATDLMDEALENLSNAIDNLNDIE